MVTLALCGMMDLVIDGGNSGSCVGHILLVFVPEIEEFDKSDVQKWANAISEKKIQQIY